MPGWVYPTGTARKVHYIGFDGRSLCGKYAWLGPVDALQPDNGIAQNEDCFECRRKLDKVMP